MKIRANEHCIKISGRPANTKSWGMTHHFLETNIIDIEKVSSESMDGT